MNKYQLLKGCVMATIHEFPRDHIFWDLVERKDEPAQIIPLFPVSSVQLEERGGSEGDDADE
ncbi:hypothetical protein [Alcanivorax sp.]|uniref:hypothetical protein n=1 Tax=Alcanivorax sp. TaxID=1872427 RepID=UPI0032D8F3B5